MHNNTPRQQSDLDNAPAPALWALGRELFPRPASTKSTKAKVEAILASATDLARLAEVSGWKVLFAFAERVQKNDRWNDYCDRHSTHWGHNRRLTWSDKQVACVARALASVKGFETSKEAEWQAECDHWDALRKGEV